MFRRLIVRFGAGRSVVGAGPAVQPAALRWEQAAGLPTFTSEMHTSSGGGGGGGLQATTTANPWVLGGGVEQDGAPQCPGCGAALQHTSQTTPGYIAAAKLRQFEHKLAGWLETRGGNGIVVPNTLSARSGSGGPDARKVVPKLFMDDGLAAALLAVEGGGSTPAKELDEVEASSSTSDTPAPAAASSTPTPLSAAPARKGAWLRPKPIVCRRCHALNHYGRADVRSSLLGRNLHHGFCHQP
jgi:hypothetical protein